MRPLTRHTLSEELSSRTGIQLCIAMDIVGIVLAIMAESIERRRPVRLRRFLSVSYKHTPQRPARNPKKNEVVWIPAHMRAVVRLNKRLRLAIANNDNDG